MKRSVAITVFICVLILAVGIIIPFSDPEPTEPSDDVFIFTEYPDDIFDLRSLLNV